MREDGLSQCGRSILMSTGIAPPTETQAGGATCAHSTTIGEEGVACNLCTLRDPSPSLQSKLHQYPARTLNQFVLPLQSTIHTSNYSCSPRREMPIIHRVCPISLPSTTTTPYTPTRILHKACNIAPGHSSCDAARSFARLTSHDRFRQKSSLSSRLPRANHCHAR
jgi:hypothetical protein